MRDGDFELLERVEDILKREDIEAQGLDFIEEINMYDEGRYRDNEDEFRVLALKKR